VDKKVKKVKEKVATRKTSEEMGIYPPLKGKNPVKL